MKIKVKYYSNSNEIKQPTIHIIDGIEQLGSVTEKINNLLHQFNEHIPSTYTAKYYESKNGDWEELSVT